MQLGRLLTVINFTLLGAAIVVYLFVPSVAELFLYVLLAWMFGSIILFYLPISHRRIGGGPAPPPTPTTAAAGPVAAAPLPSPRLPSASGPAFAEPQRLEFCIYCGTDLPTGVLTCPACGKPVRPV